MGLFNLVLPVGAKAHAQAIQIDRLLVAPFNKNAVVDPEDFGRRASIALKIPFEGISIARHIGQLGNAHVVNLGLLSFGERHKQGIGLRTRHVGAGTSLLGGAAAFCIKTENPGDRLGRAGWDDPDTLRRVRRSIVVSSGRRDFWLR